MSGLARSFLGLVAVGAAVSGTASWAQVAPLPYGSPVTLEQALQVVSIAEAEAKARHVAVTIAIVDSGGTLVLEHRMDGAALVSAETAPAKARSAVMWQRPTSSWVDALGNSTAPLTLPHVIASKGGELLVLDGRIVGAVGVGGSVQNEGDIAKRAAASIGKPRTE